MSNGYAVGFKLFQSSLYAVGAKGGSHGVFQKARHEKSRQARKSSGRIFKFRFMLVLSMAGSSVFTVTPTPASAKNLRDSFSCHTPRQAVAGRTHFEGNAAVP